MNFIAILLLTVSGCAHLGRMDATGEDALRNRVAMEWQAKIDGKWGIVYDLTTTAYKQKMQREAFVKRANVTVKEYEIKEIQLARSPEKAPPVRVEGPHDAGQFISSIYPLRRSG